LHFPFSIIHFQFSIDSTLQQPGEYVGNAATGSPDWYVAVLGTDQNSELWGNGTTTKTIFDPCPSGWKVAPNGTWSDFTTTGVMLPNNSPEIFGEGSLFPYYTNGTRQTANGVPTLVASARNGRYYTPETGDVRPWYPVAGFRDQTSGKVSGNGDYGYYWSSSANGANGVYLAGRNGRIDPSGAIGRSFGYPVRCLQE
jgi:hypothetical protein